MMYSSFLCWDKKYLRFSSPPCCKGIAVLRFDIHLGQGSHLKMFPVGRKKPKRQTWKQPNKEAQQEQQKPTKNSPQNSKNIKGAILPAVKYHFKRERKDQRAGELGCEDCERAGGAQPAERRLWRPFSASQYLREACRRAGGGLFQRECRDRICRNSFKPKMPSLDQI